MRTRMRWMALAVLGASLCAGPVPAQGAGAPGEKRDTDAVVTVTGRVTEVERPFATLQAEGEAYTIHLGPSWYWRQKGYDLAVGERVSVTG